MKPWEVAEICFSFDNDGDLEGMRERGLGRRKYIWYGSRSNSTRLNLVMAESESTQTSFKNLRVVAFFVTSGRSELLNY